jgi:hypothetical protein
MSAAVPRSRADGRDAALASPRPGLPTPPEDVVAGGYYRAGLRCARLMLADSRLQHVPVVLYTIL